MPKAPTQLQIFGERCSGTNFVAQLLRRNVPRLTLTDDHGWKHGFPQGVEDCAEDFVFVIVARDPCDWVRSLRKKPWHAAGPLRDVDLATFVREPWWCEWGRDMPLAEDDPRIGTEMMHERDPDSGERYANALQLRTGKLRVWQELANSVRHHQLVRYEDVRQNPKAFVRAFAARFGMFRWPWFRAVKTFKGGNERFVPKRYEPIAESERTWIESQLDAEVERAAGYDLAASLRAAAVDESPTA